MRWQMASPRRCPFISAVETELGARKKLSNRGAKVHYHQCSSRGTFGHRALSGRLGSARVSVYPWHRLPAHKVCIGAHTRLNVEYVAALSIGFGVAITSPLV